MNIDTVVWDLTRLKERLASKDSEYPIDTLIPTGEVIENALEAIKELEEDLVDSVKDYEDMKARLYRMMDRK